MVIFIICAIGMVVYFTTDFLSVVNSVSTIYVTIDDVEIRDVAEGYIIDYKSTKTIYVNYDNDIDVSDNGNYSVKVVPNVIPKYDFDITANGQAYPYQLIPDLTAGFDIKKSVDSFTIAPKGFVNEYGIEECDINTILSYVYPNTSIDDCTDKAYRNMFTLVITSPERNSEVKINFSVAEYNNAISLNKGYIIY